MKLKVTSVNSKTHNNCSLRKGIPTVLTTTVAIRYGSINGFRRVGFAGRVRLVISYNIPKEFITSAREGLLWGVSMILGCDFWGRNLLDLSTHIAHWCKVWQPIECFRLALCVGVTCVLSMRKVTNCIYIVDSIASVNNLIGTKIWHVII